MMLALAALAAALTASVGAGAASATMLCTGTPASGSKCASQETVGQSLDLSVETSFLMQSPGGFAATCTTGTIKAILTNAGTTTQTVKANVEELTWGGCSQTLHTLATGTLEVHHEAGTDNATVTSTGMQVTVGFAGASCILKTNNTQMGTLTGGNPGTLDIYGIIPQSGGGFICPSDVVWSGAYKVTTPSGTLHVSDGNPGLSGDGVLCTGTPAAGTHCADPEQVGQQLDASVETSALLKTGGGTTIATCGSGTVKGKLTNAGSTTGMVGGGIEDLTWGGCSTTVDTLVKGTLAVDHIAGTDNGLVYSSGAEVTIQFLGVTCLFKTSNTPIGTLTGGNPATFDINGTIPQSGGQFLCPAEGIWSGAYKVTTPSGTLHVAAG